MKRVSMSGSLRENVGKKDAKKHRAEGKVVCVMYGGEKQVHFTIENNAFNKIIYTPEIFVIDLDIDGTSYEVILQDVQYHPVTDVTLHADFLQLTKDKEVTLNLPIKLTGVSPGVISGGVLNKKLRIIPVKGLISNMPENITIDISGLNIGDSFKVADIDFGKIECQLKESALIVGVKTARGALPEDEEDEEDEEGEEGEDSGGDAESKSDSTTTE